MSAARAPLELDHLVIAAQSLEAGRAAVEQALGVALEKGGAHEGFGTRNALLSLGPEAYLEVIAIDPEAPPPDRARWFGLDEFSGPPRLVAWVARCGDLPAALAGAPPGFGEILDLRRGDLRWQMAATPSGKTPFGGLFPGLIRWPGAAHPARALPDRGMRLAHLELRHPRAEDLAQALSGLEDARIRIAPGARPAISAELHAEDGRPIRL